MEKSATAFIAKLLYGCLFIIALPVSLYLWAAALDKSIALFVPDWPAAAIAVMALGSLFMAKAMLDLLIYGKGLPMNAFPPKKLVTRGIYAWFSHPIYIGAALLAIGVSLWFRSAGGLYIVTPVLILAMLSLVYGYERAATLKIFGDDARRYHPFLSIPASPGTACHLTIAAIIFVLLEAYVCVLLFLFGFSFADNIITFIIISLAVLVIALSYKPLWNILKGFAQWVANSRRDWRFFGGSFRIINHGTYSGLAAAAGVGIFGYVTGNYPATLILTLCVMVGAALFAQFRWGNVSLLRPFGFWGAVIGGILGILLVRFAFGMPFHQAALAGVLAAPFIQAVGRLRCLSQGCCHGTVTSPALGIRIWQPQSRVVVLSGLKGEYLLPTQLYSILFNLLMGVLLFAIWSSHDFRGSLIIGLYLMLTGIERFTEDAYRGEKQTRMAWGLRENQWIAVAALILGIIITTLPFPVPPAASGDFGPAFWGTVVAGGLIVAFMMSMDFPKSNVKFSRLSG